MLPDPNDAIETLPLVEIIDHPRIRQTDNRSGVMAVDTWLGPGRYHRAAPRALDTEGLDPDLKAGLRDSFQVLEQPYGHVRRVSLKHALVVGQGSVVTRDGLLVRDSAVEFLAHGNPPDGFARGDGAASLHLPPAGRRHVNGPLLLLKRPWWRNFGHWLIDSAATLALATRMTLPSGWRIMVGRQENPAMRRVVADTIRRLAPGVAVLEHPDDEVWLCEELLYVSPLHIPPLFKHPDGLAALRAGMLGDDTPAPSRRLFVSRGARPARRVVNESELIALARARGYEVVDPEGLDFAAQVRLFRAAASVVGVKGAALTNLLFCPPGARCLLLSPGDFTDPFFWDLAGHAGVDYGEMFGHVLERDRPRGHNAFAIDAGRFSELLPA